MTAANKRYSYLRVAVIQIDVHLAGENPINTLHAFHAWFAYGPRPYISRGPRSPPFASPHKTEACPYTRKKSWQLKTDWPDRCLGSPHSFSWQPWSRGERFRPSGCTATSVYWAHITSMLLVRSMLAHGGQPIGPEPTQAGATTLKVSAFHTSLSNLPNRRSSPFHLRAPTGLQFIQNLSTKPEFEFKKGLWPPHGLLTTRPSTVTYSYA
jgi:hypothetical protein